MIIDEINSLNKSNDYSIWFYDLISKLSYNFKNKREYDNSNVILSSEQNTNKYKILKYFDTKDEMNSSFDNYILYDNKYKFLISIDYEKSVNVNKEKIVDKYNALFLTISKYIVLIGVFFDSIFITLFKVYKKDFR